MSQSHTRFAPYRGIFSEKYILNVKTTYASLVTIKHHTFLGKIHKKKPYLDILKGITHELHIKIF
jgi:hypothetical protein